MALYFRRLVLMPFLAFAAPAPPSVTGFFDRASVHVA
jgi:hypothetical protein